MRQNYEVRQQKHYPPCFLFSNAAGHRWVLLDVLFQTLYRNERKETELWNISKTVTLFNRCQELWIVEYREIS